MAGARPPARPLLLTRFCDAKHADDGDQLEVGAVEARVGPPQRIVHLQLLEYCSEGGEGAGASMPPLKQGAADSEADRSTVSR